MFGPIVCDLFGLVVVEDGRVLSDHAAHWA